VHPIIRGAVAVEEFTDDQELITIFGKILRFCDGNHSLREIAKNLKVPVHTITDFLVLLGEFVDWVKK